MTYITKRYAPPGTPPGELRPAEAAPGAPLRLHLIEYGPECWVEKEQATVDECSTYINEPTNTWIHVQGAAAPDMLRKLGEQFNIHPLALEDILNTGQRPKLENYDERLFAVMAVPVYGEDRVVADQVSVFFDRDTIVSFHAGKGDPFEPVRKRLRAETGRMRGKPMDFLFYALLDVVIDQGFPLLDKLAERIETVEEQLIEDPERKVMHDIHQLRRDVVFLRRMLWPQREIINALLRDNQALIGDETRLYLRDCYDHSVQVIELLESFHDSLASMMDVYMSSISNRLNDIMRVLTIISTLFIPPTFLVGLYGMNFENDHSSWAMPELHWEYGYPMVWLVILAMVGGLLYYFKRKDWF